MEKIGAVTIAKSKFVTDKEGRINGFVTQDGSLDYGSRNEPFLLKGPCATPKAIYVQPEGKGY